VAKHLAGEDIHDRKEPNSSGPSQRVTDEADAPLLVELLRQRRSPSSVPGDAFALPAPDGEPFLPVEPFDAFVVELHPLPLRQGM
jgi:hypothetical protein